jgi:LmbE family N-acetylglucosaminyl deacetylase
MTPTRILAVGAHPDDIELGVGATLARLADAGARIVMVVLTDGDAGGDAAERSAEAVRAAKRLGARVRLCGLPDRRCREADAVDALEPLVAAFEPDVVYTHSPHDRHEDHRTAHAATLVAARGVPCVYGYQSASTLPTFAPVRFEAVTVGLLTRKIEALAEHHSQQVRCDYLDPEVITTTARYWARFGPPGRPLVEPFEVYAQHV